MHVCFVSKEGIPNGMPTTLHFVKTKTHQAGINLQDQRAGISIQNNAKNVVGEECCFERKL
jgi:hypothetical protein